MTTVNYRELIKHFSDSKRRVKLVSEFSYTPIGKILFEQSSIKKAYPDFLINLPGALIYLSDKLYMIQQEIKREDSDLIIFDRFIMSQIILGMYFTKDEEERKILEEMIIVINQWLLKLFGQNTTIFLFNTKFEIIAKRIENKIGTTLDPTGKKYLKDTINAYQKYEWESLKWRIVNIDNNFSINSCTNKIIQEVNTDILLS